MNINDYTINYNAKIEVALEYLDKNEFKILFILKENKLVGSISDGDIRRSLIKSKNLKMKVFDFMNPNPKFINANEIFYFQRKRIIEKGIKIAPILNKKHEIIKIVNLNEKKIFPVDVVIMAGGKGQRLAPLTDNLPKPLLKINDKPIIEIIYDRFLEIGTEKIFLSVNYLKNKIKDFFNVKDKNGIVEFVEEDLPLGTFGSLSLIDNFKNDTVLVINADILTNIDFEIFYEKFLESKCDFALVAINFKTIVQYAILKEKNNILQDFIEKPHYDNFINTGIYLMKKSVIEKIPRNKFYNATDLLRNYIETKQKIYIHKVNSYWKDIGKIEDLNSARSDINKIF